MAPNVQVGLPFRGCISNFWDTSFSAEQWSSASMCKRELFVWRLAWTQLICGASSIVLRRQTHLFPRQWWQIGELPSIAYNRLWRALGNINSEHCMVICDERVHWNSQITLILIISNACKNISVCTRCMHACMHANIYGNNVQTLHCTCFANGNMHLNAFPIIYLSLKEPAINSVSKVRNSSP